jgi:hypothetical protein
MPMHPTPSNLNPILWTIKKIYAPRRDVGLDVLFRTFSGLDSARRLMKEEMWALMYFSGHFRV